MDCQVRFESDGAKKAASHVPTPLAHRAAASGRFIAIAAATVSRRIGRFSFPHNGWIAVIVCLFFLTGCASAGSPPPGVTAVVFGVMFAVWKSRKLGEDPRLRYGAEGEDFTVGATDIGKHVLFFLRWRAETYLAINPDKDSVANAIAAEYDKVKEFVDKYIGLDPAAPRPLIKSADSDTFTHLALADVLRVLDGAKPVAPHRLAEHEKFRWNRAMSIVWHAAALELDLWIPSFSKDALKEILDRRLRIVERMMYQINSDLTQSIKPSPGAPHGPWPTGCRVRMFEYPFIDRGYETAIGPANIGEYGQADVKIWRKDYFASTHPTSGGLLYYAEGLQRRIAGPAALGFVPTPSPDPALPPPYSYDLSKSAAPSNAVDQLFTPSSDWWARSWLYCDHVLAAVHIESFLFGKRRRTGNEDSFNALVNGKPDGWVKLRPLLGGLPGDTGLMTDDRDKPREERFFYRGPMPRVQLGDHIVFWNSILYGLMSDGAWSLENAVVIDTLLEWNSSDVGDSIVLIGHGTGPTKAEEFRRQLVEGLDGALEEARNKIAANAGSSVIPWLRTGAPLVKWAPYGEAWIDAQGHPQAPWWIQIPFSDTGNWKGRALGEDATVKTLPDAIKYDATAGFTSKPPTQDGFGPDNSLYFPLWVPAQQHAWKGYIERRKSGSLPSRFGLEPHSFHGNNVPGFTVPRLFVPTTPDHFPAGSQAVLSVRPIVAPI